LRAQRDAQQRQARQNASPRVVLIISLVSSEKQQQQQFFFFFFLMVFNHKIQFSERSK
jgi:hypothetical protein